MSPLKLPATLLHDQADDCLAKWVAQLPADLPLAVVLDASGLSEFDSSALAVLAARGEKPVASATFLTTLINFTDTGILDVFIDENFVKFREQQMGQGGLLKGQDLASTFSFLRPNDLVWNYVVGNYLKGETPPPFDLLYWNSDSTNLPGPFYAWYLRNTYLENNLVQPGKVTVCGEAIDLGKVDLPVYIYGSRNLYSLHGKRKSRGNN